MQKQQGAALIIVLVLLSVSLVIGMSGMSAALVDERLAGNYSAAVLAQMNAERAASESMMNDILIGNGSGQGQEFWSDEPGKNLLKNNLQEIINSDDNINDWKDFVRNFRYEDVKEEFSVVSQYDDSICDDEGYSQCLYFPVYIDIESEGPERYIVAFGAIKNKQNDIIAKSPPIFIELSLKDGDTPPFDPDTVEDAISVFDSIGMLAGEKIDIDNDGKFDFVGLLQAGVEFEADKNFDFEGDGSGEVGQADKMDFPFVDVDMIIEEVKHSIDPINDDGEDCILTLAGDQEGGVIFCDGDVELSGNFANAFIVADGDIKIIDDVALENVFIIAGKDIENVSDKNGFSIKNSFFFSKEEVDLELKGNNTIDGFWIYSGDDIDIDIKGGGNEEWVGGLIARRDIDFDTNGRYNFRHASASTAFSQLAGGAGSSSNSGLMVASWES